MTALEKNVAPLLVVVAMAALSACAGAGDERIDPYAAQQPSSLPTSQDESTSRTGDETHETEEGSTADKTHETGKSTPTDKTDDTDDTETDDGPGFIQDVTGIVPIPGCSVDLALGAATKLEVDRLETLRICFDDRGWSTPTSPPRTQLTLPDGSPVSVIASRDNDWLWEISPGTGSGPVDAIGTYTFRIPAPAGIHPPPQTSWAPTGSSSTSPPGSPSPSTTAPPYFGTITVVRSGEPRLVFSTSARAGGTVSVSLAGYPPGSTVPVVVYGPGEPPGSRTQSYRRVEALPGAGVGADGEGQTTWTVPADIESGQYGLWADPLPPPRSCPGLCLGLTVS